VGEWAQELVRFCAKENNLILLGIEPESPIPYSIGKQYHIGTFLRKHKNNRAIDFVFKNE
jgi:hypothetical protein